MKKVYVTPEITAYEADPTVLLCNSIGGGEPGNGDVMPQSLDYGDDDY